MNHLPSVRRSVIDILWNRFTHRVPEAAIVQRWFEARGKQPILDHFAIIDLPGPKSGIPALKAIFSSIGFVEGGRDYIPEKQNPFMWLKEENAEGSPVAEVLPKIVIADFDLKALPYEVCRVITNQASQAADPPLAQIAELSRRASQGDKGAAETLVELIATYLISPPKTRPSFDELETVMKFNELLGWVLLFRKEVNHFGLSVYLDGGFSSLVELNDAIAQVPGLHLSHTALTAIKGSPECGIEQSATVHSQQKFNLDGGIASIPNGFVEFVWRHRIASAPLREGSDPWDSYFQGFFSQFASRVVESLHRSNSKTG
jgi:hypothetical protein